MADFTSSPQGGRYDHVVPQFTAATSGPNGLTTLTNVAGAFVSLALIAGIGIWSYDLVMRDVSGVPVVRAAQGEMRVRPADPGGELAQHQGLSVNAVASEGTAAGAVDVVRLAPEQVGLAQEDQPIKPQMVATAPQADAANTAAAVPELIQDASAAIQSGEIDDLVAQLTQGLTPLEEVVVQADPVVATVTPEVVDAIRNNETQANTALRSAPGVRQSLRPQKRPEGRTIVSNAAMVSSTPAARVEEVDPASIPVGTRLVQLGAFDSAEIAVAQWGKLDGKFGEYLRGKNRVVQKATSGGRVFYRLRAVGFADLGDARRFCSALVAGKAECIPVVSR